MLPIKVELPASTPRDLQDEFAGLLRQLGTVGCQKTARGLVLALPCFLRMGG